MAGKLEVSFNSPQCGWMSIGFTDGESEFHTTTAHSPYENALPDLMRILTDLASDGGNPAGRKGASPGEYVLHWNRDPEAFDFRFVRNGNEVLIEIWQYPTEDRDTAERELAFSHSGAVPDVISAFAATFDQLHSDRDTDEFEFNWRQPFPYKEYEEFKNALN